MKRMINPGHQRRRPASRLTFLLACLCCLCSCTTGFNHFVSVRDATLMDGEEEFRFISFNIPNLHYVEDEHSFTVMNPWRLPNEFEIRDALTAVRQMGCNVVRMYTLSVRKAGEPDDIPRHVLGPGEFNEAAFIALDKVLQMANETGVRIIIPFVDNWKWWGGVAEYAAFRGKEAEAFWHDPELIGDYKKTVAFLVNRRNTFTGELYKDDKAILAWETGNELESDPGWVAEVTSYIKSVDPNHLVIDGFHSRLLDPKSLEIADVDIVTTHHYAPPARTLEDIRENARLAAGKKPYFVGEFGFIPLEAVREVLDTVIDENIAGALLWSLRFRSRDSGFYWHFEYTGHNAYHWPGFASNDYQDERSLMELVRWKNAEIRGIELPALPRPLPPELLPIEKVSAIRWRGSTGATAYDVERAEHGGGPWTVVGLNISDAAHPYRPLFADNTAEPGKSYYYRVRAKNQVGLSGASAVIGPVIVQERFVIDEFENLGHLSAISGALRVTREQADKAKSDMHRLQGHAGDYIAYDIGKAVNEVKIFAFFPGEIADFEILGSSDGASFHPLTFSRTDYSRKRLEYTDFHPVLYHVSNVRDEISSLRIVYKTVADIGRAEIYYARIQSK